MLPYSYIRVTILLMAWHQIGSRLTIVLELDWNYLVYGENSWLCVFALKGSTGDGDDGCSWGGGMGIENFASSQTIA